MSKTINLGRVTAYADAVAAGYTGTREQFANDLANAANYAAEAGDAAETATEAATTASTAAETATDKAEEASADAEQAHADAQAILGAKETAVAAAATASSKAGEAANSAQQAAASETAAAGSATTASDAATSATASKNAAATSETNAANSASQASQTLTNVNQAGATQVAAIQAKGTEVLNSIPADYTSLSNDVDDLKSDLAQVSDRKVLFDYSTNNYITHNGSAEDGSVYIIKTDILPSISRDIIVSVNVYENCNFYIGLVSKLTNTVLYGEVFTLQGGINTVKLNYAPEEICYLILDQGKDKLLYDVGTNITYVLLTGRSSYPAVGELLPVGYDSTADFAVGVMTQVDITYIENTTNALSEDVTKLNASMYDSEYASETFDYNADATPIDSFLLLQPAPYNGTINKIHFKRGSNYQGVEITVFEWDGETVSVSAITAVERYVIEVIDGVANVRIPIKNGQYIGVSNQARSVCTWYRTSGAGFIYTPETATSIQVYSNTYITLSYEMTIEGSVVYTANKVFDERTADKGVIPFDDKNIFLAGDSRSSTDYTFYGSTLKDKTGANVLVKGASGSVVAYQASNAYFSRFTGTEDFVIWLTGGNDTGETVGTFDADYPGLEGQPVVTETNISQDYNGSTFIQAVDHIMRKWKSLYYDWKTLNNGHKPTLIFCSEIPQQRYNANTEWSKKENWIRKCLAIRQCCEKNGVFYLDLYNICNFDMSFEPFWTSPTDKVTNNGLYYMDGLHPNKYGIDLITSAEIEAMKNFIRINA